MWKNLTATGCAGALLAMAVTPSVADEQFIPYQAISLPDAQVLSAFDISFVDAASRTLAVAASRVVGSGGAFGTVIIVNTDDNIVTKELGIGSFVGDCSTPPNRDEISGPNGVMIIKKGRNAEVWAGDGPVFNTACTPASGLKTPSTVKVFDLDSGAMIASIPTGTGAGTKTPGQGRADELCANSSSKVVLIANPLASDNFITFVNADTFEVIQRIRFDGTDPNGDNILANGIEQCIFNPKDGNFYLNIPNTGASTLATPLPGVTVRISGKAPFHVEKIVADFSKAPLNTSGCAGGSGIALGPDHQLANDCGVIIDDRDENKLIANFESEGGADEIWFNPGDGHYFFADTTAAHLGVVDAGPPPSADLTAKTAPGSHSVAADSVTNEVYVPIRGNNGTVPPTPLASGGNVCSKANDVFGLAGSDALGCILTYIAPSDSDDHGRQARR
jgi:hypothetical protein